MSIASARNVVKIVTLYSTLHVVLLNTETQTQGNRPGFVLLTQCVFMIVYCVVV